MSAFGRPSPETLRWAETAVWPDGHVTWIRAVRLGSTAVHAVNIADGRGRVHRLILRRFVDESRLGTDPWYAPSHEADVLHLLARTAVRAPELVASDLAPEICDAPTLLTTRIPGRPPSQPKDMQSFIAQMAEELVVIHSVAASSRLPSYERYYQPIEISVPPWSRRPDVWRRVLECISEPGPVAETGFIHRDYHHDNTLWLRGRMTGVVDWSTGSIGPRGIDLARMRQNLAADYGVEWPDRFGAIYGSIRGREVEKQWYWDLVDSADSLPDLGSPRDDGDSRSFLRFEEWVASVLEKV